MRKNNERKRKKNTSLGSLFCVVSFSSLESNTSERSKKTTTTIFMDDNIHNVTRGLVRAILTLTAEQRHWLNVQSLCQYIYCKFSFDDHDDTNATCHVTSDRLPLPDESPIPEHLSFAQLARYICLYIYPIFIFMGIFGNSLSCFIMFLNVRRNGYSANLFLTLLAFIDCLYLLGSAFPYWIAHIDYRLDVRLLSNFYCRLVYWFGNITTHLSAGLVVSVTIERFIAVKYPLIAHKINTVKNTHLVLIILATFFFILDSRVFILVKHFHESIHIVFTCLNDTKIKYERREILHCGIANEINEQTWVFLDFAVYTMIPFLIIVTLNSLIIHRLITAQRLRQSMSQSSTKSFKHIQECLPRNNTSMSDHVDLEKQQRLTRSYSMPEKLLSQTLPRPPRSKFFHEKICP